MSMARTVVDIENLPLWQRRSVMACMLMGVILSNLDSAIANIALPTISVDLHTTSAASVWVVNAYQLAQAVCLLPVAACGEILGVKRVYAFGLIVFTLASLACAVAPNIDVLVASRVAQGIGGSCLAGLGPGLVRSIYPRHLIGPALGTVALVVAVASAAGPSIAAAILSVADWPWLFLVNLPVGLVVMPLFIATASDTPRHPRAFDFVGAVLNAIALGLIVVGVGQIDGPQHDRAAIELVVGLVAGALLFWHQASRPTPLLPLDLLRIPSLSLAALTAICAYGAQILAYISLPFLFQAVMHRSAIETGLLVTPWPLMVAIAAPWAGKLIARKYRPEMLIAAGSALMMVGLLLLLMTGPETSFWNTAWRMGLCGVGFAFIQTPNNVILMTGGPLARASTASALVAVARTIGWALGSAAVALIFSSAGPHGTPRCIALAAALSFGGIVFSMIDGYMKRNKA